MERAFLVTKESVYYKDLEVYLQMVNNQKNFVKKFFGENNIEAEKFYVGGDGICNRPFKECAKKDIRLAIIPTKRDLELYKNQLLKADTYGLCRFRANSKISKSFAQECVDKKIVINVHQPDLRSYLNSIDWRGYSLQRVPCEEGYYIKVTSDLLKEDDNPKGFIPIKISEFYIRLEEYKEQKR